MNKKNLILILVGLALTAAIALIWTEIKPINNEEGNQVQQESGIILYHGIGCPFCDIVDEYIAENKVADSIVFTRKEIWRNPQNAAEFNERVAVCGIPANEAGVPLLWDGSRCYIGADDIIAFFENQLQLNQQ